MSKIQSTRPVGARIADIGAGGREYNIRTIDMPHTIIDRASLEFMHVIRDRAAYREAIQDIKKALDDPAHGAYYSDLWAMVWNVIDTLESKNKP